MNNYFLGVDTGGTFTDFTLFDGDHIRVHKVLSTPEAPERAILQGIRELGLEPGNLQVVHGSTVATNAVLEGKGVRTVYIGNRGMADVLQIGRQARRELYNLQPQPESIHIDRMLCLEVDGRIDANGREVEPVGDLDGLLKTLQSLQPQAVAINLLFSFLNDAHEKAVAESMPAELFVSCSSDILPEYREYERGMTTWLNASVGPLVQGYLRRLQEGLAPASVAVMQSSGGTIDAGQAGDHAVHLLLSGPAGGLMGARAMAACSGIDRLLTFDMGGTSTDVAMIDGDISLTSEGQIAGYPVAVPMVDMHTIGAGGGSIAAVDAGGLLQVGPESAGASPGPACYGQGGRRATVTDANTVLGRLQPGAFLGGGMQLDVEAAQQAVADVAITLGVSVEKAAEGILQVANEHMVQALRVISVQRGHDPADFTLVSFGGAGGLHVCALAEQMGMHTALVPMHGGVLSAFGMLVAPRSRHQSRTLNRPLQGVNETELEQGFAGLWQLASAELQGEGLAEADMSSRYAVDLRYSGQSYTLTVPWQGQAGSAAAFHELHRQRYGHDLDHAIELVNIRVIVAGPEPEIVPKYDPMSEIEPVFVTVHGISQPVPMHRRESLKVGARIRGPALIVETVATTWLAPGWEARVDNSGNLLLENGA